MIEDSYYIVLTNRHYRHEFDNDDFHLEKVFSKDKVLEIIESETPNSNICDLLIITNDNQFLSKFIFCINDDEFKMLSRFKDFNERKIRINKSHFSSFNEIVFSSYIKIKNHDIVSANMSWSHNTTYPYDDPSIGIDSKDFDGWVENKEFNYFETPVRYRKNNENKVFSFTDIKKASLKMLESLLNINILEIGNELNQSVNWEFRNDYLRYYDKVSCKRFYITKELLDKLKADNEIEFVIETKLDKNHYIEYYVTGIYTEYEEEEDIDDFDREDNSNNYQKYNGAYGLNDPTIDSAFEGDPENYWNID
jgi:hypothetical protein